MFYRSERKGKVAKGGHVGRWEGVFGIFFVSPNCCKLDLWLFFFLWDSFEKIEKLLIF